ncbi:hypothetical protein FRB97_001700 [Tulasnella sp. 331]|nr:hypothetical protein FRB98_002390 [Tulasnella sp. 332]KAG8885254.1 hypothetical protein FRB97_001700 [Tulasnella sp. 331]
MHSRLAALFFLSAVGLGLTISDSSPSGHLNRHRAIRQHISDHSGQDLHVAEAIPKPKSRRSAGKSAHCAARLASNGNALNATSVAADSVNDTSDNGTTDTSSSTSTTTTTQAAETTRTTETTHEAQTTTKSTTQAAAPTASGGGGDGGGTVYTDGDATYYGLGLGACGWTNKEPDMIAAMAFELFDSFATTAAEKGNPNDNPVCGRHVTASLPGLGSVTVEITDRCGGCMKPHSLDFSMAAFNKLTNNGQAVGRFENLSWEFID